MVRGLWLKVIVAVLFIAYVTAFNYGGCIEFKGPDKNNTGSSGNGGSQSNPPATPTNLVATAVSDSQINLNWQKNSNNVTIFKIERASGFGFSQIATVDGNTTFYTDTRLNSSADYYYRVRASNGYGESNPSNEVYATTQTPATNTPNPPTSLSANATSSYQINLTWTDSNNESGYKIERSTTSGSGFTQIATVNANITSYSDIGGLTASTTYYYQVRAYNSQGDSNPTNEVSATTQTSTVTTPPPAPTSLNATAVSPFQINLSWTTPSGAQSITIERSFTSGSGFSPINTVSGNTTTYSDYNLSPSTLYYYRIRASNSVGDSSYSPQASATTQNQPSYSISGSVSGGTTGRTYIEVRWGGGEQTPYGTSIAGTGNFTIRGLQPGIYSLYAWRDHLGKGQQNASNPTGVLNSVNVQGNFTGANITLNPPTTSPTPVAPTNLVIYPGPQSALAFFDTSKDNKGREIAESYKIYWGTTSSTTDGVKTVTANGDNTPPFITGLTDAASYYFKVTALVAGITESAASNTVGPVTIGAPTGNYSVSGTVYYSGVTPPTGPLYVGVFIDTPTGPAITYTSITSPTSPQAYTISGIANGTYQLCAVLDVNNNGLIDGGDVHNTQGGPGGGLITVNNSNLTNQIQTLSAANGIARVNTDHWRQGTNDSYNVNLRVSDGRKLVVAVAVASGPGITGVTDICKRWEFEYWLNRAGVRPTVTDSYTFNVTYSDGTAENLSGSVTAVLDTFAQNLTTIGSNTTPTFTWQAPASAPTLYSYRFQINQTGTVWTQIWDYPKDTDMPSSQTSLVYNVDGKASQSALTPGTDYNWTIRVQDAQGNSASQSVTYRP